MGNDAIDRVKRVKQAKVKRDRIKFYATQLDIDINRTRLDGEFLLIKITVHEQLRAANIGLDEAIEALN
tara:strand:- start:2 stop:208 length:207 start_codon:yes stop_codon:yes gene_type:complete